MTELEGKAGVRQEAQDISGFKALLAGAVVIVVGGAAVAWMAWMLGDRQQQIETPSPARGLALSPIEQARIEKTARGQELQQASKRWLDDWGWVVPGEVARIPVAEASRWLIRESQQRAPSTEPAPAGGGRGSGAQ